MSQSGFNQCMDIYDPKCITDSGSSQILLPLIESVCDDLWETNPDTPKKMGSLLLDLEGVNGSTITLPLPLLWLAEQIAGTSGDFALGLPIFHYYYLVYDMENSTVTFVDLQLSNETEAFIHGPELGGVSEPNTNPAQAVIQALVLAVLGAQAQLPSSRLVFCCLPASISFKGTVATFYSCYSCQTAAR